MRVLRAAAATGERGAARAGSRSSSSSNAFFASSSRCSREQDAADLGVRGQSRSGRGRAGAAGRRALRLRALQCRQRPREPELASRSSGVVVERSRRSDSSPAGRRASRATSESRGYRSRPRSPDAAPSARRNRPDAFFQLASRMRWSPSAMYASAQSGSLRERALEGFACVRVAPRAVAARPRPTSTGGRSPSSSSGSRTPICLRTASAPSQSPASTRMRSSARNACRLSGSTSQQVLERGRGALQEPAGTEVERQPEQRLAAQLLGDVRRAAAGSGGSGSRARCRRAAGTDWRATEDTSDDDESTRAASASAASAPGRSPASTKCSALRSCVAAVRSGALFGLPRSQSRTLDLRARSRRRRRRRRSAACAARGSPARAPRCACSGAASAPSDGSRARSGPIAAAAAPKAAAATSAPQTLVDHCSEQEVHGDRLAIPDDQRNHQRRDQRARG